MKQAIQIFLICVFFASTAKSQTPFEVTLDTQMGKIEGILLYPDDENKPTVVLIIAGSGPTDRNGNNPMMSNNSLKMLAEGLAADGIASLRYDKRGVGKSVVAGIKEIDLRFENYVNDAKAWIDWLAKDERFGKIIILGHSEGSLIGMLAAQKSEVDKYISMAGAGTTINETIREQLKAQPLALSLSVPILDKLEMGETVDSVPPMLFSLFRPSVQPYLISWFKYDPQAEIAKLTKPILIVQGTTDIQVKVMDAELLHKGNSASKLEIVQGMNHVLKQAELDRMQNLQTYNDPNLPLHNDLLPLIISFVKN